MKPHNAPWRVRVDRDAIDARVTGLRPQLALLLQNIEAHARNRAWTWVSNETLAQKMGCTERCIQKNLTDLQSLRKIARVMAEGKRGERMGIILLDRFDRERPHCRTAEEISQTAEVIRAHWAGTNKARTGIRHVVLIEPQTGVAAVEQKPSNSPGKIDRLHERRDVHQHERRDVLSTNGRSSELGVPKDEPKQQQGKPLPPDSTDAQTGELAPDAAEAVARVRAEASASKPTDAVPLAAAVERMARAGHDPGRLEAIARESLRKDRPVPYFLAAVTNRAAEEDPQARLLRGVPKPPPRPKGQTVELTAEDIAFFASAKSGCGVGRKAGGVAR